MTESLTTFHARVQGVVNPFDLFGPLHGATLADRLHAGGVVFKQFARLAHEDRYATAFEKRLAHEAFSAVTDLWRRAQLQLKADQYGPTPPLVVTLKGATYTATTTVARGDLTQLYVADRKLLKVSLSPSVNAMLVNEAKQLTVLGEAAAQGVSAMAAFFPTLYESALVTLPDQSRRQVNVLGWSPTWRPLTAVQAVYPDGLDGRHVVWMGTRVWAALGYTHRAGLVHGAVCPEHLLIHAADHGLQLIDWCYAVTSGQRLTAIMPSRRAWYPPEVLAKQPATPATDVYMAAACLWWLAGGDPVTMAPPVALPGLLRQFLTACLLKNPARRPVDAWELFDDWGKTAKDVYGRRTFVTLEV